MSLRRVDPSRPRGRLYRALARFSATPLGMRIGTLGWRLDPFLLRVSGGRLASTGPIASALLETRGARTGVPRRTAVLYFHDGERVIVVASFRGEPRHPAWFHNLRAHPEVALNGEPHTAEVVTGDERARLWPLADRVFPPFADYRTWAARSDREIPIVALTARRSRSSPSR